MNQRLFPYLPVLFLLAVLPCGCGRGPAPLPGQVPVSAPPDLPEASAVTLQKMNPTDPAKLVVRFDPDKAPAQPWQPDWEALRGPFQPTGNPGEFSAPVELTNEMIKEWQLPHASAGLTWPARFGKPVKYKITNQIPGTDRYPWSLNLEMGTRILQQPLGYPIDPFKSLLVISPAVVNDPARTWDPAPRTAATPHGTIPPPVGSPTGVWTFHHLVSCLAHEAGTGVSPSALVGRWLESWATPQYPDGPDGNVALPRDGQGRRDLIRHWPGTGGPGVAGTSTDPDTTQAPFRLLAIVNRFDLRSSSVFGNGGTRAELRFVFSAVNTVGSDSGDALDFLVIFEFGVPLATFREAHQYARQWAALSRPNLDPADYLRELEILTEKIVRPGTGPSRPHQSNLSQVRTVELYFGLTNWEFREFHPDAVTHQLKTATVAQTPGPWVNEHPVGLRRWIQSHRGEVKDGKHLLPETLEEYDTASGSLLSLKKLRGAMAQSGASNTDWVWLSREPCDPDARRAFIRNTCNGCHTTAADGTAPFDFRSHVGGRAYPDPSPLSPFLHNPGGPDDDLRKRVSRLAAAAEANPRLPFDEFFVTSIQQVH